MKFAQYMYTPPTPTRLNSTVVSRRRSVVCIGYNRFKYMPMLPYTATTLSQHLVPMRQWVMPSPPNFIIWGDSKKNFGAILRGPGHLGDCMSARGQVKNLGCTRTSRTGSLAYNHPRRSTQPPTLRTRDGKWISHFALSSLLSISYKKAQQSWQTSALAMHLSLAR